MGDCKMAYIAPLKFTLNTRKVFSNYHLLLAQEFLTLSPEARDGAIHFWRTCKESGHFIILDNGAYELGAAMYPSKYMEMARLLEPSEIVLPDVLLDSARSMEYANMFMNTFQHELQDYCSKGGRLMAVVQADSTKSGDIDMDEIAEQLDVYYSRKIHTIGIPKHFGNKRVFGRVGFAAQLEKLRGPHGYYKDLFNWHFLGVSCVPEIVELAKFSWVRGIDSAVPFVYALADACMKDYDEVFVGKSFPRPDNFFECSTLKGHVKFLISNVSYCRKALYFAGKSAHVRPV